MNDEREQRRQEVSQVMEQRRHRQEVCRVLGIRQARGREFANDLLDRIETARGKEVRDRVEADVRKQWRLGNRGLRWVEEDVA